VSEQIHLSQKRMNAAIANREFSRLFDVLTRHFPTMHGRDISWAIEDYMGLANPTLEFRNEIAVIPGRHTWIRNLGDAARAALVDDAVSLRRLTVFGNKIKIEASVLLGDRDEEVEIYGKPDCWDFGRRRSGFAGGRGL
jgi:hypothetical protein